MTYLLKGWHVRNEHFSLKNIKDKYVQINMYNVHANFCNALTVQCYV